MSGLDHNHHPYRYPPLLHLLTAEVAHDVDPGVCREVRYGGVNRTSRKAGKAAAHEAERKAEGCRGFGG